MHPQNGLGEKKTAPSRVRWVLNVEIAWQISHHALGCAVVVVRDAVFVLHHLSVQFVDQVVNCGVQVFMGTFSKKIIAFDVNVAFSALAFFLLFLLFNGEQYFDIDHLVKMSSDAVQFACDIAAQGGGNFEVVTADREIHINSLLMLFC